MLSYKLKKSPSALSVPNTTAVLPLRKATAILCLGKRCDCGLHSSPANDVQAGPDEGEGFLPNTPDVSIATGTNDDLLVGQHTSLPSCLLPVWLQHPFRLLPGLHGKGQRCLGTLVERFSTHTHTEPCGIPICISVSA